MVETHYIEDFLPIDLYLQLVSWLSTQELFSGFTKKGLLIDRTQKWFHIKGECFNDKWSNEFDRWKGHKFPDTLLQIINYINKTLTTDTNSCLVNYYETGEKFIPRHIDSVTSFGAEPTIINLSIGATRILRVEETDYQLKDNGLFIMTGPSAEHELIKDPLCKESRWSLTFRKKI